MGRRRELQGICNDLLDSFVSRYNDLRGFWALGKFQSVLQSEAKEELVFHLVGGENRINPFPQTLEYYRSALVRHLCTKGLPPDCVREACINVQSLSPTQLNCRITITTDRSKKFSAERPIFVRSHRPELELRRHDGKHGPSNQKGL